MSAGGGQTEEGMAALQAAALELLYRSPDVYELAEYAESEGLFRAYQGESGIPLDAELDIS